MQNVLEKLQGIESGLEDVIRAAVGSPKLQQALNKLKADASHAGQMVVDMMSAGNDVASDVVEAVTDLKEATTTGLDEIKGTVTGIDKGKKAKDADPVEDPKAAKG